MIQTNLHLWWETLTLPPRGYLDARTYRVNPASVRQVDPRITTCEAYVVDTGREVQNCTTLDRLGKIVMERGAEGV